MTTAIARFKEHFANWRHWELNPVVVKELRQAVRSWAVTGMLLLFLGVLFVSSLIFLITQSFDVNVNQRVGADIFQMFTVILTGASLLFIPAYVGVRLAAERQESNLDLLYITTLTPERIIRGKFLCGAYTTVLFFSACMPFMVFTNLLRGVDLPTIFFILVCLFLVVCAAIQVAIFVACLPISRVFKILAALIGLGNMFSIIVPLVIFFSEMMRSGVGSMMGGRNFWAGFATSSAIIFFAVVLLYFVSVALISPLSTNRALPLRICVTVIWIIGAIISMLWMWKAREARVILPWAIITFILLCFSTIVVISNHDQLSFRVRKQIPANPLKRAIAFLFYNGAAGGLVWIFLLSVITFAVTSGLLHFAAGYGIPTLDAEDRANFDVSSSAIAFYMLDYALTALFLHRRFFNRRSSRLAGIFAVLLPGAWAVGPAIFYFFVNRLSWRSLEQIQLGNVFNVAVMRDLADKQLHLYCAAIWFGLMLALNARWFMRQIKFFQPLQKYVEPPPVISAPPPAVPAAVQ